MAARLPTGEDLGLGGSLESRRGIATYDTSALARGQEALARGVQSLGGSITNIAERRAAQGDSLEEAQARADLITSQAKRRSEIGDAQASADLQKTHEEGAQADLDAASNRITDPAKRALFMENARPTVTQMGIAAKDKAFRIDTDAKKAEVLGQLDTLKQTAISDKDDGGKETAIRTGQSLISGLEKDGYITAVEAEQQRKSWARSYATDALQQMNPVARLAAVRGGWEGALINRESSGNPRTVNQFGYAGLYQFGAPLLDTLGLYKPGANENLQTWSDTGKDAPGKWSGSFNIPGYPGVRTLADFRESPDAQRAAFVASQGYYDGQIVQKGLDKFIGQSVQGVPITREGIYSMMHLGGVGGAEGALKRGQNAKDANGSGVLDYARMAANAGPGAQLATFLSPEQKIAAANGAVRDLVQQDRQSQQAQANEAATVKGLIKDDQASTMASGAPIAELTHDRVSAALGPAQAEEFVQNRQQAVRFHDATNDWNEIPVEEIRARLGALAPAAGSPGYESANQYYSLASKQADAVVKERRTDPAAAADRLPDVKAALDGASLDRPESYQPVAKARAIAQERLGIPQDLRVPMTKAEAQQVAKPLQLASEGGDGREIKVTIQETLKQLQTAFGDDSDTAFQQVLREAHLSRATDEMAAILLKKLARGEPPTQAELRSVDEAGKTSAADQAVAAVAPPAALNFDPTVGATGTDYLNPQAAPAPAATFPTPDAGAIGMLRKQPALARQFDATYGPGASERVMAVVGAPRL